MIESLKLSSQTVPLGSPLSVDVTLSATGTEEINQTVEILATNSAGKEVPQGKRTVRLKPGEPIVETFQLTDLSQPFAQGQVRLGSGDPLDADNRRYFTVGVQFPPRVLIVDGEAGRWGLSEVTTRPAGKMEKNRPGPVSRGSTRRQLAGHPSRRVRQLPGDLSGQCARPRRDYVERTRGVHQQRRRPGDLSGQQENQFRDRIQQGHGSILGARRKSGRHGHSVLPKP